MQENTALIKQVHAQKGIYLYFKGNKIEYFTLNLVSAGKLFTYAYVDESKYDIFVFL